MKIYIVTSGEYSDYGIDAVFLDKEKAEKYCEIHNAMNKNIYPYCYDEWETQDDKVNMEAKVVKYYYCDINLETGKIDNPSSDKNTEIHQTTNEVYTRDTYFRYEGCYITGYSVNSFKQAQKIAIEQWQLYTQRKAEEE